MARYDYKVVKKNKGGMQQAEKLKKAGWTEVSASEATITFQKKRPEVTVSRNVGSGGSQNLYSIPIFRDGKHWGWSLLGFEVCRDRAFALAKEMGLPQPRGKLGSLKLYEEYQSLVKKAQARNKATGWRSQSGLDPKLIGLEGKYVEVVNAVGEKERFWVGKSTGWIPCHLAIARRNSSGGGAVLRPVKSVTVLPEPRLTR
jgi:hypothetical protein